MMVSDFFNKYFKTKPQPNYLSKLKQGDESKKFVLMYGEKEIGFLEYKNAYWYFRYSNWFKNQSKLVPLLEFPDKAKVYQSKVLWAFFNSRIPAPTNREKGIGDHQQIENDIASLLENFGKRTINNPFILKHFG